jgi:hypothetical protein
MAACSQLEVGRPRCGRSVGAEDVSGTGGLPIGPACMSGRTVISSTVPSAGVCASLVPYLWSSRARIQVDRERGRRVMGCSSSWCLRGSMEVGVALGSAWRSAQHQNTKVTPTSTRDNSTNMEPIQAAVEAIEGQGEGENLSYTEVANKYNVSRHTLAQRCKGIQAPV